LRKCNLRVRGNLGQHFWKTTGIKGFPCDCNGKTILKILLLRIWDWDSSPPQKKNPNNMP
jgi:hypothetical protein